MFPPHPHTHTHAHTGYYRVYEVVMSGVKLLILFMVTTTPTATSVYLFLPLSLPMKPSFIHFHSVSHEQQQNPFFAHTQYNKGSMGSVGSCQNTLQMCCAILLHTLKYTCRSMCYYVVTSYEMGLLVL